MSDLVEESGDIVEEGEEVAEQLEEDLTEVLGVDTNVDLSNVNPQGDQTEISFNVVPDGDALQEALVDEDKEYYEDANFRLTGSINFRLYVPDE